MIYTKFYNYEFLYDKYIILIFKMALLFLVYTGLKHFFLHIFKNNFCVQELEQKRSCPVVWVYSMARTPKSSLSQKLCKSLHKIETLSMMKLDSMEEMQQYCTCVVYVPDNMCAKPRIYRYCTYAVASSPDVTGLVFMLRSRLLGRWGRKM